MEASLLKTIISASLLSICMQSVYASPEIDAKIFQEKATHYAVYAANHSDFDMKMASRELYQNVKDLVAIDSHGYALTLDDVTSAQCLEEVAQLGIDSQTFVNKALAGQYKTISMVDGNVVMLIAGGAGQLTFTVIDKGGYCKIDKSIHDAYWAGKIIRLGLDGLNFAFSI